MTKIFISYRREDSADATGRIGDWLRNYFGEEKIFTDVDNIPLGVDFRTHLDDEVSQCDVLLAVIGIDWLSAKNSDGELRLNDPSDFVRIEIESALRRDIPVIPLLVRGASVPQSNQLPESIADLAFRNAQKIRPDSDFKHDANRLVRNLVKHLESDTPEQTKTVPVTSESIDDSLLRVGRWQSTKQKWIGVVISISAIVVGLYKFSLEEQIEQQPQQQGTQSSDMEEPSPSPAIPVTDFIAPEMVKIPPGSFMMGSVTGDDNERPVHEVTVPGFELARNELTWAEWQRCEDDGGCIAVARPGFISQIDASKKLSHPVVKVSIERVNEYLAWINEKTGLTYRLPSEAEWEYATRAGSTTDYYWGNAIGENQANCDGCGSQWDGQSTAPVGSFSENPFGLNDMHGNVLEWVADCWHDNYEGAPTDGTAWVASCSADNARPMRGGSLDDVPEKLRAAKRVGNHINYWLHTGGFRLARTLP